MRLHKILILTSMMGLSACVNPGSRLDETASVYLGDGDHVAPIKENSMVGRAIIMADSSSAYASYSDSSAEHYSFSKNAEPKKGYASLKIKAAPVGAVASEDLGGNTPVVAALHLPHHLKNDDEHLSSSLHIPGGAL